MSVDVIKYLHWGGLPASPRPTPPALSPHRILRSALPFAAEDCASGGVAGEGKDTEEWKERGDPWYPDSGLCWEGLLLASIVST